MGLVPPDLAEGDSLDLANRRQEESLTPPLLRDLWIRFESGRRLSRSARFVVSLWSVMSGNVRKTAHHDQRGTRKDAGLRRSFPRTVCLTSRRSLVRTRHRPLHA